MRKQCKTISLILLCNSVILCLFQLSCTSLEKLHNSNGREIKEGLWAFISIDSMQDRDRDRDRDKDDELHCSAFIYGEQDRVYKLDLKEGAMPYFLHMPSGEYRFKGVECIGVPLTKMESIFPTFRIEKHKISYLGQLQFSIDQKNRFIEWKLLSGEKPEILKQLRYVYKSKVISAYNKLTMTESLVEKTPLRREVFVKTSQGIRTKYYESLNFRSCEKQEEKINPLRLGIYAFQVIAENKHIKSLKVKDSQHIYSANFEDCVRSVLEKTPVDDDIHQEINLIF